MTVFFTADTHLGHTNIIKYANRPFSTCEEMDETIIRNWNRKVKGTDLVYHLGDFAFRNALNYRMRLNGRVILIRGNHDKAHRINGVFNDVHEMFTFRDRERIIVLCHYGMRVWDGSHFGSWHLYGHSHGKLPGRGKSFDIGVDAQNFEPRSLGEVIDIMKSLPDNQDRVYPTP